MYNDGNPERGDDRNPERLLGSNIRARREAKKLSQRAMASQLGIQQATLHKIELGERTPTPAQARLIAKFFEYELTELHLTLPGLYPAPAIQLATEAA